MSGRLFIDQLIDRIMSAGVPRPKGARMAKYKPDADQDELVELINTHAIAWRSFAYQSDDDIRKLANNIARQVCNKFKLSSGAPQLKPFCELAMKLISLEPSYFPFYLSADVSTLSPLQIGEISNDLNHRINFITNTRIEEAATNTIFHLLAGVLENMPSALAGVQDSNSPTLTTDLISLIDKPHDFMTSILSHFVSSDDVQENQLFAPLCRQLYRNILEASGIIVDPDLPLQSYDLNRPVLPNDCIKEPARDIVGRFFANTPIADFLYAPARFSLPQSARFEHCHVLGGIGHGKTQCLQYLLHDDLIQAVRDKRRSIVVIDSQGSLIRNISSLALFNPEDRHSLADRFLFIDPTDIERPPALNLFNPGLDRMENYTPHQREVAFNSLVDIYGRFFGSLLGAELTGKQGSVFRYLARLMLTIEGATIHTLIALMDDVRPFASHIAKLDPTARGYFENEFMRKGYNGTRQQIKDRLYAVLSIPTFDRLFSAPKTKINFFDALNNGKIILIDTAKGLLKTEGTAIFGRFILALIEHAITERDNIPENKRNPVFLYMDEAHEYFDDTVETLIIEARKFKCGLTLAHQDLVQVTPKLRSIFMGNTTIKIAGGISDSDARAMSPDMRTKPDFLLGMKKYDQKGFTEFALSVRNITPQALKVTIPFGHMEGQPKLAPHLQAALLEMNRQKVGYDPQASPPRQAAPSQEEDDPQVASTRSSAHAPSREQTEANGQSEQQPTNHLPDMDDQASKSKPTKKHQELQNRIKQAAQQRGFSATIEQPVLSGKGRVDVALERDDILIACEVSVTTKPDHELHNIKKCLEAGYDQVWVTSPSSTHLNKLRDALLPTLPADTAKRIWFLSEDELISQLDTFTQNTTVSKSKVLGYEVEVVHTRINQAQAEDRRKRLVSILNSVWQQNGGST